MEKKEVKIDKETGDLAYNDELHIYWNKKSGERYTSVTTLIGKYHEKFDYKYWLEYKALERLVPSNLFNEAKKSYKKDKKGQSKPMMKYLRTLVDKPLVTKAIQEIRSEWSDTNKKACDRGSRIHSFKEGGILDAGYMDYGGSRLKVLTDHLVAMEDGVYPELMMYDNHYMVSGQADRVIKEGACVDIHDYKTNKRLDSKSYYSKEHGYRMMMKPISHLMDCNLVHYQIQLSIYAYILERKGLKPRKLTIEHIDHEGNVEMIEVKYLREEVEKLLTHYKRYKRKHNGNKNKDTGSSKP